MRRGLPLAFIAFGLMAPAVHAQISVGHGCDAAEHSLGNRVISFAAYANGPLSARAHPGGRTVRAFAKMNPNGVKTVFGVLGVVNSTDCTPAWYRVQLPIRPNGATGFVRADAVTLYPVRTRIHVDLSAKRLDFYRDGRRLLSTRVGIGTSGTPTPTGRYYVNQRLWDLDVGSPFGPGAVGISAFSPVLKSWAQGGPVAIHGTDDPSSVGRAASHGCIRVENDLMRRLLRATMTGSLVVIHA
jgi:lipoprotein-anchoring transpeptidase ErfK/SrfK